MRIIDIETAVINHTHTNMNNLALDFNESNPGSKNDKKFLIDEENELPASPPPGQQTTIQMNIAEPEEEPRSCWCVKLSTSCMIVLVIHFLKTFDDFTMTYESPLFASFSTAYKVIFTLYLTVDLICATATFYGIVKKEPSSLSYFIRFLQVKVLILFLFMLSSYFLYVKNFTKEFQAIYFFDFFWTFIFVYLQINLFKTYQAWLEKAAV